MSEIFIIIFIVILFYLITFIFNILIREIGFGYLTKVILSIAFSLSIIIYYLFTYNLLNKDFYSMIIILLLLNSYIYLNIIQVIVSSIRVNILKIFIKNKNYPSRIKFDNKKVFKKRISRLLSSKILELSKNQFRLNKKKILLLLIFYIYFKKLYNMKKIYH